jgi:hypothetical protein
MNDLDEARNGLNSIPAKLPANVLDPTAMRAKPRLAARALQMVCRLLAYNAELVPRPATFSRFVSSQSAGAGAQSVWLICTSWANPWP